MAGTEGPQIYRYPLAELTDQSDFFVIGIAEYTANPLTGGTAAVSLTAQARAKAGISTFNPGASFTVNRRKKNAKKIHSQIFLPMPSNIQDGNSVKYTEGSLDGLTAATLGIVLKAFYNNEDNPGQAFADLLKSGADLGLSPGARQYFLNNLATEAANMPFGGNLTPSQLLARQTGNILNPNMELLFDGVTLRSFKFSFKLTPRNPSEATQVKNIIRTLKRSMAPGTSSTGFDKQNSGIDDLYLSTPNIFELSYMKGPNKHPFLHKFKECFLTDMSVNYTGEGTYATYGDTAQGGGGTPVSMIMDLAFKEVEPIYGSDYGNDVGGVGY